jgi:hypothetical protein
MLGRNNTVGLPREANDDVSLSLLHSSTDEPHFVENLDKFSLVEELLELVEEDAQHPFLVA